MTGHIEEFRITSGNIWVAGGRFLFNERSGTVVEILPITYRDRFNRGDGIAFSDFETTEVLRLSLLSFVTRRADSPNS